MTLTSAGPHGSPAVVDATKTDIRAVGVVIPARNEEATILACLTSVLVALDAVADDVPAAVCVVLDRCDDGTEQIVADALAAGARTNRSVDVLVNDDDVTVGELRDRGMRRVLARLAPVDPAACWLLSTDADTTVPMGWATQHLARAERGEAAVAGMVDLDGWEDTTVLSPAAREAYLRLIGPGAMSGPGGEHDNVYAANLGIRGDVYLEVGGFPRIAPGEEHALLARLRRTDHLVSSPTELRVRTSARQNGRASGGLADLLGTFNRRHPVGPDQPPATGTVATG